MITHVTMAPVDAAPLGDAATRARLAELVRLDLLGVQADARLRETVAALAGQLALPVALVSILLDDAQLFLASHGLSGWVEEVQGSPIEWSFCQHAIVGTEPLVVPDATRDPRVADSPFVTQEGIACYAGAPLVTARGVPIGTVCVLGATPRTFAAHEVEALQQAAAAIVADLEARARARDAAARAEAVR